MDSDFKEVFARLREGEDVEDYRIKDGLLMFKDKLCIPRDYQMHTLILEQAHVEEAGHFSFDRT